MRKGIGCFAEERKAAEAATKAALREWPVWSPNSRALTGPGRFTAEDIKRLQAEIEAEAGPSETKPKSKRLLPKGVVANGLRFEARYTGSGQTYLGLYKTVEEAQQRVLEYTKEVETAAWQAHLEKPIPRDADGDAVIAISGKKGSGQFTKVPDHLWHQLTHKHSWSLTGEYANGWWEGKVTKLHIVIYRLLNPGLTWTRDLSIDHINSQAKLDNRACNLRLATRSQQNSNRVMPKHG